MYGKILFQELWRLRLSWDDLLPSEHQDKLWKWVENSVLFKVWSSNRCYFSDIPCKGLSHLELHAFGDASVKSFSACVLIRTPLSNGSYQTALVASKSRVASIKTRSVPRLELLASLVSARLIIFVGKTLKLKNYIPLFRWTDSKIVLALIQGDPYKWKMFVANTNHYPVSKKRGCTVPRKCSVFMMHQLPMLWALPHLCLNSHDGVGSLKLFVLLPGF